MHAQTSVHITPTPAVSTCGIRIIRSVAFMRARTGAEMRRETSVMDSASGTGSASVWSYVNQSCEAILRGFARGCMISARRRAARRAAPQEGDRPRLRPCDTASHLVAPSQPMTDFNLQDVLAELDSEEASNFGLAVRPMTRFESALLVPAYVRRVGRSGSRSRSRRRSKNSSRALPGVLASY
jgi:hypothetical protein